MPAARPGRRKPSSSNPYGVRKGGILKSRTMSESLTPRPAKSQAERWPMSEAAVLGLKPPPTKPQFMNVDEFAKWANSPVPPPRPAPTVPAAPRAGANEIIVKDGGVRLDRDKPEPGLTTQFKQKLSEKYNAAKKTISGAYKDLASMGKESRSKIKEEINSTSRALDGEKGVDAAPPGGMGQRLYQKVMKSNKLMTGLMAASLISDLIDILDGNGEKGEKGDTGATGGTGDKGDKGDTGATGGSGTNGVVSTTPTSQPVPGTKVGGYINTAI